MKKTSIEKLRETASNGETRLPALETAELENTLLKRMLADLTLENEVLKVRLRRLAPAAWKGTTPRTAPHPAGEARS